MCLKPPSKIQEVMVEVLVAEEVEGGRGFRGGKNSWNNSNRPQCQLCGKYSHLAWQFFHRTDQSFQNPSKPPINNPMISQPTQPPSQIQNSRALLATPATISDPSWYLDSRASHHFTPDVANLLQGSEYMGSDQVFIGNGISINIQHIGHSLLHSTDSNSLFKLDNLMHVPTIAKNLISVSQFAKDNNIFFEFYPNSCYVKS